MTKCTDCETLPALPDQTRCASCHALALALAVIPEKPRQSKRRVRGRR